MMAAIELNEPGCVSEVSNYIASQVVKCLLNVCVPVALEVNNSLLNC